MASECSMITAPTGTTFPPTDIATAKMCTSGTAAKVLKMGTMDDYGNMFGAGIGIDFNNPGGTKGTFDASGYKGIQFKIDGDNVPTAFRVEFPTTATHGSTDGADYADADGMNNWPMTKIDKNALNTIMFDRVHSPTKAADVFDVTHLEGVQFHVPTNTSAAVPFSYCISNLALVK